MRRVGVQPDQDAPSLLAFVSSHIDLLVKTKSFAHVEEREHSATVLPGVKFGY